MSKGVCDKFCIGCIYHATEDNTCIYWAYPHHGLRGCPAGKGCIRKVTHSDHDVVLPPKENIRCNLKKLARATKAANRDAMRLELYNQGMTDAQISESIGATPSAVAQWRRTRSLPVNGEEHYIRKEKKLSQLDICMKEAKRLGMTYVEYMAKKATLPPPPPQEEAKDPRTRICKMCGQEFIKTKPRQDYCSFDCQHRKAYLDQKERDRLAREKEKEGQTKMAVFTPEQNAERMRYYKMGLSDAEIAAKVYCDRSSIGYWRKIHGLENNYQMIHMTRCRDCAASTEDCPIEGHLFCFEMNRAMPEDAYCSLAKRKEV